MTKPVAVGDPIEALFNLSEDVAHAAPRIRRDFLWGALISLFFLGVLGAVVVVLVSVAFSAPRGEVPAYGIAVLLVVVFIYIAVRGLLGAWRGWTLLGDFLRKHEAIRAVKNLDPIVRTPSGDTILSRYAQYLKSDDLSVKAIISKNPDAWQSPLEVKDTHGRIIKFDIGVVDRGSWSYRLAGIGRSGRTLLVREVPIIPTLDDIEKLLREAKIVGDSVGSHAERLVFLSKTADALPDPVYDRLVGPPQLVRRGVIRRPCVVAVVSEASDGTYDFTPHIVDTA